MALFYSVPTEILIKLEKRRLLPFAAFSYFGVKTKFRCTRIWISDKWWTIND